MELTAQIERAKSLVRGLWSGQYETEWTPDQQIQRIAEADPVGFLVTIMKGEPLLAIRLEPVSKRYRGTQPGTQGKEQSRRVLRVELCLEQGVRAIAEYWTPSLADRKSAAEFLAAQILPKTSRSATASSADTPEDDPDPEHTAMMKRLQERTQ